MLGPYGDLPSVTRGRSKTVTLQPERLVANIENLPVDFGGFNPSDVLLNIYHVRIGVGFASMDFAGFNSLFDNVFGAFHVGVEVFNNEWQYGWCQEGSGVCASLPRANTEHTYCKTVYLGRSRQSIRDVDDLITRLIQEWRGKDYNIASKNCLHFARHLSQELGVDAPPNWLFRLSGMIPGSAPFAGSVASSTAPSRSSNVVDV